MLQEGEILTVPWTVCRNVVKSTREVSSPDCTHLHALMPVPCGWWPQVDNIQTEGAQTKTSHKTSTTSAAAATSLQQPLMEDVVDQSGDCTHVLAGAALQQGCSNQGRRGEWQRICRVRRWRCGMHEK